MKKYIEANDSVPQKQFLAEFPYEEYLSSGVIFSPEQLHDDYVLLNNFQQNSDQIMFRLFQTYLAKYPANVNNFADLQKKISMAEDYQLLQRLFKSCKAYYAVKDLLFEEVAKAVEEGVKSGESHPFDPGTQYLLARLQENKYYINVPQSDWSKLSFHVRQGNWSYIWDRLTKRWQDHVWQIILIVLTPFAFLFIVLKRRSRK